MGLSKGCNVVHHRQPQKRIPALAHESWGKRHFVPRAFKFDEVSTLKSRRGHFSEFFSSKKGCIRLSFGDRSFLLEYSKKEKS